MCVKTVRRNLIAENLIHNMISNLQCDICSTNPKDIILPQHTQGRILYCTCPLCRQKVGADIYEGSITCPACGPSVPWDENLE